MSNKFRLLNYSIYPEKSGTLIPFYSNKSFPKKFKIKRFFIIFGKKKFPRADHAHKKTTQIIIPLRGKIKIIIFYKKKRKTVELDPLKKKALYVPPYNWIQIKFKNNEDSFLTLCDYKYDKKEYISDFGIFKNISSQ